MRRRAALATMASMTCVPAAIAAARTPASRSTSASLEPFFPWDEARKGQAWISQSLPAGGNNLLLAHDGRHALVDTKVPHLGAVLREDVRAITGTDKTPTVIVTHYHADHSGGVVAFRDAPRAIAHRAARPRVNAAFQRNLQSIASGPRWAEQANAPENAVAAIDRLTEDLDALDQRAWEANVFVTDEADVRVGAMDIRLRHFGAAHTDNDLVVFIEKAGIVHVGDLVFAKLHPFFDANGGCFARGWVKTLETLLNTVPADWLVVPGHGKPGGIEIIREQRDYVASLIAEVERGIQRGDPRDKLAESSWPFMDGYGFERLRPIAVGAVYDQISDE